MMRVLCGTIWALLAWSACGQTNGEWSANRLPGTNRVWTAARTRAEIAASTQGVVQAASTVGWETGPHAAWITAEGEQDARALAFAATNRVRTWVDETDPLSWWVETGSTNRTRYTRVVSGTNYQVELSADFLITSDGGVRPDWTNSPFPFIEVMIPETPSNSELYGQFEESAAVIRYDGTPMFYGDIVTGFPVTLTNITSTAIGTATVSIASYVYSTNAGPVYVLTTGNVWQAIGAAQDAADEALEAADLAVGYVNSHLNDVTPHDGYVAPASVTNAPTWVIYSNIVSAVTVTNLAERPARIYGTGTGTGLVSFASMREPLPLFFEMSGFEDARFPGAYVVGGGSWQTNRVNLFIAFRSGTNDFVTPVTTREP